MTAPITVKAVIRLGETVLLGENDRGEWELLGGRPERDETAERTLVRELQEEAGVEIVVGPLLLDEAFEVVPGRMVRVLAHRCEPVDPAAVLVMSDEHRSVAFVPLSALDGLRLPDVYRRAIALAG
jgi:8-oxo-dGTP diphosphatase